MALEHQYQKLLTAARQAGSGQNGQLQQRAQTNAMQVNHQGYKKFLDAVSKLFLVEFPVCALVARGKLLSGNAMILLQELCVAFNAPLTHGVIKLNIISNALTNTTLGHEHDLLRAAAFCYSRIAHDGVTTINDINKNVIRKCQTLIQEAADTGIILAGLPTAQEMTTLSNTINQIVHRVTQITNNPAHQNHTLWEQYVIENTIRIIPEVEALLLTIRQNNDLLQYLQQPANANIYAKLLTTLDYYDEYRHCIDFVLEFAVDGVVLPGVQLLSLLDANDVIDQDEQGINYRPHADMQALNKLLRMVHDDTAFLPYVAISRLACGMCFNIIEYESHILNIAREDMVRGTHGAFYPENWAIPRFCLRDDDAIHNLEDLIGRAIRYEPVLDLSHQDYFLHQ